MSEHFDVVVIGGGPAGAAAAITAARRGKKVALLEAGRYPRHKVCGEFVSAESLQLLASLLRGTPGTELLEHAPRISKTTVHLPAGRFTAPISPSAASITRYELDLALWKAALASGVDTRDGCGRCKVEERNGHFVVVGDGLALECNCAVYAIGRRGDLKPAKTTLVGIKAHFRPARTIETVELYFGDRGYCGVQPISGGLVNVCALVEPERIRNAGVDRMSAAFDVHQRLNSAGWEQVTETIATAMCVFASPEPVKDGIMCAGDAAGFIDPFLGDGISLALQSGTLAGSVDDPREYEREYRRRFLPLFRRAARLRRLLHSPSAVQKTALLMMRWPALGAAVVAATRVKSGDPLRLA
ncbi:MAG: NAD(P)/FAD-dependent oxidoreductase [Terriglobales bacterium]